jgi:elongation factor 1-alpha
MNLVVIGHVDHGKSTTLGHFLYNLGVIDERTIKTYEEEAKKLGKESFKYAWILDRVKEERERGLTIDLAFQRFETKKYYFTLIDAPGHRDFVKNMITGASQADAAILVVSAKKGEAEVGIAPGGQTREHAYLSFVLGIKQLIVLINKMDDTSVNWAKERYDEVRQMAADLLKTIGYDVSKIHFIPVSGWLGDNLTEKSKNIPWYNGPTLLEALDMLQEPPKPIDKPLRIPIQAVLLHKGCWNRACGQG